MSILDDIQLELDVEDMNSVYYEKGAVYQDRFTMLPPVIEEPVTEVQPEE